MARLVSVKRGQYDEPFFALNASIGLHDSQIILPQVLADTGAQTVIDVGCGTAAWAATAKAHGCKVHGIDGHVALDEILIDPDEFELRDLKDGVSCAGYDLAICLEFGEHLPESSAAPLVAGLCDARYVLFSGAHPGQGGVDHINEQWSSWWAELFAQYGFVGSCAVRDRHWSDDSLQLYHRENVVVFATPEDLDGLGYPQEIRDELHPSQS